MALPTISVVLFFATAILQVRISIDYQAHMGEKVNIHDEKKFEPTANETSNLEDKHGYQEGYL